MNIFKSKIIEQINTEQFRYEIISYLMNNRCCIQKCNHANYQSNAFLHEHFDIFKQSINQELKKDIEKLWVLYAKKGDELIEHWHKHDNRISCLLYLTDTELGTKFENFDINLKKNSWLVWQEDLLHAPMNGILKQDRITIAGILH